MNKSIKISLIIFVLLAISYVIYFVYIIPKAPKDQIGVADIQENSWVIYKNSEQNFSIKYPGSEFMPVESTYAYYLTPIKRPGTSDTMDVKYSINSPKAPCERIASFKNPDGEILKGDFFDLQHTIEIKTDYPNEKLYRYEILEKYFYSKNDTCYIVSLMIANTLNYNNKSADQTNIDTYRQRLKDIAKTLQIN